MSVPTNEYDVYAKEFGGSCCGQRWPKVIVRKAQWRKRGLYGFRTEFLRLEIHCNSCRREWDVDVDKDMRVRALRKYNLY